MFESLLVNSTRKNRCRSSREGRSPSRQRSAIQPDKLPEIKAQVGPSGTVSSQYMVKPSREDGSRLMRARQRAHMASRTHAAVTGFAFPENWVLEEGGGFGRSGAHNFGSGILHRAT